MLLILLIIIQAHWGDFTCTICVTQPLLTSNIKCPICTTLDGNYSEDTDVIETWENHHWSELSTDDDNPHDWTSCSNESFTCNALYKYRSFDGSCNNLEHPTRGMANTAFTRLLPSHYRDRKHLVRLDTKGYQLPLVRKLSTEFFPSGHDPDSVNLMVMQWGQVVAQDIVNTPSLDSWDCCNPLTNNEEKCFAFIYPPDDPSFLKHNITCTNFKRKQYTRVGNDCENGPAQQINGNSHQIDGSVLYGSDLNMSQFMRTFICGRLKTRILEDGREFLPNVEQNEVTSTCSVVTDSEPCYITDYRRANSNPQYAVLITMLQRAHNNIADKLHEIHPTWEDEKLFQETRRILVAILQHIHYKEWLVFYVGERAMRSHYLYPSYNSFSQYNKKINLIVINSFQSGAFRIGHSGIQRVLHMYDYAYNFDGGVHISDWMKRPLIIEKDSNYDKFLLGLVNQPMQKLGTVLSDQESDFFPKKSKPHAIDLVGTDILRGRDHGLAPYVHYLEICTGFKAATFDDLNRFMPEWSVLLLQKNYASIQDIDLLIGGSLENPVPGARLGETFLCIFSEQFYRLKFGDRFWYEVENQPHSFTTEQLKEIKKMTLSKLICDNGDHIKALPRNSFKPPSFMNIIVDCSNIPGMNLTKF